MPLDTVRTVAPPTAAPLTLSSSDVPEGSGSATSWGAILAGAAVALATSLILLTVGAGIGFAMVSPWQAQSAAPKTFAITGVIWLIVTQWVSAAVGGYLAGRLRARWTAVHTHEVFFRDTAHGLIAWSVATILVTVVLAVSAERALAGATRGADRLTSLDAPNVAVGDRDVDSAVDRLLRAPSNPGDATDVRRQVTNLGRGAFLGETLSDADRQYLIATVAQRGGSSSTEAQTRVDDFLNSLRAARTRTQELAEEARKSAEQGAIYTALSLLIGAFVASAAAALGGRLRIEQT